MARHKGNFEHGTVSRYRQGDCSELPGVVVGERCADCKRAMSLDRKAARAGMSVEERNNVVSLEGRARSNAAPRQSNSKPSVSNPQREVGPIERSIHEQFDPYRAEHGARIELLLAGARIMDDPDSKGIWPTTMRQMEMIIEKITAKKKTKSGGRLSSVSAMAGRRSG